MNGDCCVLKFLRRNVDGKHLMRFQSETSVFISASGVVWTESSVRPEA